MKCYRIQLLFGPVMINVRLGSTKYTYSINIKITCKGTTIAFYKKTGIRPKLMYVICDENWINCVFCWEVILVSFHGKTVKASPGLTSLVPASLALFIWWEKCWRVLRTKKKKEPTRRYSRHPWVLSVSQTHRNNIFATKRT